MRENNNEDKAPMQNITINIPEIYDKNIQKLKEKGLVISRSQAVRTALKEYLEKEYGVNLKLLNFFDEEK
jgi:Arc/MetJ-type ribon-helix-helix transcriptional regulator